MVIGVGSWYNVRGNLLYNYFYLFFSASLRFLATADNSGPMYILVIDNRSLVLCKALAV